MLWKTLLITFLLASASLFVVAEDAKEAAAPAATEEAPKAVGEKFEFQAEVSRLMDIIINSLYTNREIFIRELISNAADAMDKIRFQALTDKSLLGEGDAAELDVKIRADKEKKTLTITDKGLGMTKEELIKNLGIVARSGTSEFVEAAAKGADSLSLIGQFGVGFYSVYLVADRVTVHSKSNNDDQYIWESTADSTFTITKDPEGNTIPRGTRITLHLKEDAEEYLSDTKLKELVAKYSQFINFPISVHSVRKEESEVVDEEATAAAKAKAEEERTKKIDEKKAAGEEVNEDDFPVEEVKDVKKKVSHDIDNWEVVNSVKAIWTRAPADITEEQYQDFYKSLTKDSKPYLDQMHFTAEGEITFKSILYIPSEAEAGLYDKFYEKNAALKLYVRRVLITDDFKDFIPRYMNFIKGVVDSDDLPLNVNRETLAQSRVLKVMSKKITRKVIEMLRKLASDSKKINEEAEEQQKEWNEEDKNDPITAGTTDEEKEASEKKRTDREAARKEKIDARKDDKYTKFWNQFGKSLKLGLLDDRSNKNKLVKLIRFETSKSQGKLIGFEEYVDKMKEKQKNIYYLTGENMEQIKKSPFLEQAMRKDIEIIYFDDSLDEYVVQSLPEYEGNTLQSLTKEGLTFGDEKKKLKAKQEEEFKPACEFLQSVLSSKVEKVVVSQRIAKSPMVLVTGQYGWSANMERIMKTQAFGNKNENSYMISKKTLEINPYHPMIKRLNEADKDDQKTKDLAMLLYDATLLQSGFAMDDAAAFTERIQRVVSSGLGVSADATVEEEPETDLEDESKPESEKVEEAQVEDEKPASDSNNKEEL